MRPRVGERIDASSPEYPWQLDAVMVERDEALAAVAVERERGWNRGFLVGWLSACTGMVAAQLLGWI